MIIVSLTCLKNVFKSYRGKCRYCSGGLLYKLSRKEVYSADYVPKSKREYVEALLTNAMVAVWNKLVRHNLYKDNNIRFIPGIDMGEDELVSHKLFYYADKVVYLPLAFVHYVCYNPNSYSSSVSRKSLSDILLVEKNLLNFYTDVGLSQTLCRELLLLRMRNWQRLLCYSGGRLQKNIISIIRISLFGLW